MLEVSIGGEERAETCAGGDRTGVSIARIVAYERQHFVCDVAVVARQHLGLVSGMRLLVQERLPVHAVDRVGSHVPCVYVMADRINQMKPLVLQKIGRRRGKEKDG